MGMIASVRLPNSEVDQFSASEGKLNHLLMGDSELCGQPITPPCLLGKELGVLPATGHKDLQRRQNLEAWKENMMVGSTVISYLANQGDNVSHRA